MSRSNTEAEYWAMAYTITEVTWLAFLLCGLHIPLFSPLVLLCDNINALQMTINLVFHAWSKHELDYHFVRERVTLNLLVTRYVSSLFQAADIFTKPMFKAQLHFRIKLCL